MEEADALCTRTVIMARRILAIGTTQALRQRYNNEYFVNLVLGSAPKSTAAEMRQVTEWVRRTAPDARFEREVLGGQVRFTLPTAVNNGGGTGGLPIARLMEALEQSKRALGIEHYSVSGPTLEDVFLSVVRENNVEEESGAEKKGGLLDVSRVRVRFPGKGRAWCRL